MSKSESQCNGLYWRSWGDQSKPPLLMLHGFLGDSRDWELIVPELTELFYCIACDFPGHGQSPVDPDLSINKLLSELEFQFRNSQPLTIIAYSMGGRIAMQFSEQFPSLVKSIILESASPGIDSELERRARTIFDRQLAARILRMSQSDFIDWWCDQPMFGQIAAHPGFPDLRRNRSQFSKEGALLALERLGAATLPSLWPKIQKLPIGGYFVGELDTKYVGVAKRLMNDCPNILVKIIPGLGHNCHFEAPSEFVRHVKAALRST
ncbi:alpha/beta fold hydrolase [bacterium]|nr:alpha/beta fold hydrolase [bacterium]